MSRASTLFQPQTPNSYQLGSPAMEAFGSDVSNEDDSTISFQDMSNAAAAFGRLDHFAHKTYKNCHGAGDDYGEVAHEVHKLHNVLRVIRDRRDELESRAFRKDPTSAKELMATSDKIRQVLEELDTIMDKFERDVRNPDSMSAARRKVWLRVKYGSKKDELATIRSRLANHTAEMARLLQAMRITAKPRSRPHSVTRQNERGSDTESRDMSKVWSIPTPRRPTATASPQSTSPPEKSPMPIPSRLVLEARKSRRSSYSELTDKLSVDAATASPIMSRSASRLAVDTTSLDGKGRRRRSSSLMMPDESLKAKSLETRRPSKSRMPPPTSARTPEPIRTSRRSPKASPRPSPLGSKASSPVEESFTESTKSSPEQKIHAGRSASESAVPPPPTSPMIEALDIEYFRRASAPTKGNHRGGATRNTPSRAHRMSLQLDDVQEIPERCFQASKLSTVTTPDVSPNTEGVPSMKQTKSAPEAKGSKDTFPAPLEKTVTVPTNATSLPKSKPAAVKARPGKPVLARTTSGRPFTDPWKALTMDTKQLKALRAEANRGELKLAKKPASGSASARSSAAPSVTSEAAPAEYIKGTTVATSKTKGRPRKSIAEGGKSARETARSKASWYTTLNDVRALHNLKLELAPPHLGSKLKGILKGPGDLKRDPGAPAAGSATGEGPQFTKISRRVVCPEALELGHEKFEIRNDDVVVLRVLSRQEIEGYASRSKDIRESRKTHHDVDSEADHKMANEIVSGLANLATMFLHKKS